MIEPTPTVNANLPQQLATFDTLADALDYAAQGETGFNFYSGKGELVEALSYSRLRIEAQALAARLLASGLKPGDRVAQLAESDGDFARIFFACQYARLVPVPMPLPAAFGGREAYVAHIRRMIENCGARAAFGPTALAAWIADAVTGLDLVFAGTLAGFEAQATETVDSLPSQDSSSLSYIQFSSGSTRFPLGAAVTQKAFMANARAIAQHGLKLTSVDRGVSWLPLYHDMGLVGFFLTPLTAQVSIDLLPTHEFARRPLVWLDLIGRNKATLSYSPSFGYELCARRAETLNVDHLSLSSWRAAGIGGDMIRPEVLDRFAARFAARGFDANIFTPSYGMAETTLALSFAPLGKGCRRDTVDLRELEQNQVAAAPSGPDARPRDFVLCGPILPDHKVEVRDATGAVLPERRIGRIFVSGPSMMRDYFGAPEETAAVLSADGWLDTGDLGYILGGEIVITGRAKDLIIINGRNIWPQDLEWSVEAGVDGLRSGDVAVFSIDRAEGESVCALVQCRLTDAGGRAKLAADIAALLRSRHGVEADVRLVPARSLPKTSSGKLSRAKSKAQFLAGDFDDAFRDD
ncbi:fatty acyl-AMP ligase [Lacibacterium aquatile]|uniref:Fatty acyl-AMP ligase n=1 Tax=Lacibacterium aquatile TaxID=1168082 RepID=A0ABW5DZG4_9PROT